MEDKRLRRRLRHTWRGMLATSSGSEMAGYLLRGILSRSAKTFERALAAPYGPEGADPHASTGAEDIELFAQWSSGWVTVVWNMYCLHSGHHLESSSISSSHLQHHSNPSKIYETIWRYSGLCAFIEKSFKFENHLRHCEPNAPAYRRRTEDHSPVGSLQSTRDPRSKLHENQEKLYLQIRLLITLQHENIRIMLNPTDRAWISNVCCRCLDLSRTLKVLFD